MLFHGYRSMTLRSVERTVHYIKAASTGCAKRTGAGPDHLLIGTVALFRMGKRVPVAQHHFRHPGAPRCGHGCGQGRHPALFRLLARRQRAGPGTLPGWRGTPLGLVDRPWAAGHAATGLQAYVPDSLRAKVNVPDPAR